MKNCKYKKPSLVGRWPKKVLIFLFRELDGYINTLAVPNGASPKETIARRALLVRACVCITYILMSVELRKTVKRQVSQVAQSVSC
jgi:hypothetical protein